MARRDVPLRELLDVATEAALVGGRRTLAWFGERLEPERKADGSPVTAADRDAERVMRQIVERAFPDHAILGEEHGERAGAAPYRWLLDPIDGTKTFVQGVPLYGTLVGVEREGEPVVGVVSMPALGEVVAAAQGLGCTWNGRTCRVSGVDRLDEALVVVTDPREAAARPGGWAALSDEAGLVRTWADCYGYVLVATGRAEVAVDARMNAWDCAAVLPIVEEAGGRFTDWTGRRTIHGGDAVATNAALDGAARRLLAG